ncbi:MAG: hypothetical protein LBK03_02465, partial [Bacteroidales bacterium]|nr:hypothetical protein [Bacteroidales bacterium]
MKKQLDKSVQRRISSLSFRILTILLSLTLAAIIPGTASAQVALTPTTNASPPAIVPMGDSLVYTFELNGASVIAAAVTKVRVPSGYEILPSTPNQVAGTLAADRRSVTINTSVPTSAVICTVYIKPLCNADVYSNNPQMVVTYQLYPSAANAAAGTAMITQQTETFANIYEPIL